MLALVHGEPKILSLKQMLEHYLRFQVEVITNRTKYDLEKAKKRAHILQGFVVAIDYIDEVIAILRSSKTIAEGKQRLMERFQDADMSDLLDRTEYDMTQYHLEHRIGLSEEQADAIVQMRLGQLTGMERKKVTDELYELIRKISEYLDILADERLVYEIIRTDLREIARKFKDERRTTIENVCGEVDIEDLIPVTDCVVTYTNSGYMKRMPVETYKLQRRGGRGVNGMKQREEDYVNEMFISSSHDHILFISNKGVMYKLKCYEIPEGGKNSKGFNIVNLITMAEDEYVAAILHTADFESGGYVNIVTKRGKIKRTELSAYRNVRKNGLIAIGLDEGDEIAGVQLTEGEDNLFIATRNGMILRTPETGVRPMSRSAHGVKAIALRAGDEVVAIARERAHADLLTITTQGYGRRSAVEEYRMQNRGGYGLTNYKTDAERGTVCGIRMVEPEEDIILISSDGVIIRVCCEDIRVMGRTAKGVRTMRVAGDNTVVAFTSAEHDDSAETAAVEQAVEEPEEALPEEATEE
jgi:DNA gyrase subunit A